MATAKIGFIGTGIMGAAICGHILDAGYDVTHWYTAGKQNAHV